MPCRWVFPYTLGSHQLALRRRSHRRGKGLVDRSRRHFTPSAPHGVAHLPQALGDLPGDLPGRSYEWRLCTHLSGNPPPSPCSKSLRCIVIARFFFRLFDPFFPKPHQPHIHDTRYIEIYHFLFRFSVPLLPRPQLVAKSRKFGRQPNHVSGCWRCKRVGRGFVLVSALDHDRCNWCKWVICQECGAGSYNCPQCTDRRRYIKAA